MANDLAFMKDKNQVATPWHVVDFLSDLFRVDGKTVLDPTAGSGAMFARAGTAVGVEFDPKAFLLLKERVPHGEFLNASIFEAEDWIRERRPDAVLMNPPFNCQKSVMPEEYRKAFGNKGADNTKGLYFVQWVADAAAKAGATRLAAVLPTGAIKSGNKAVDATKRQILERHSVEAVLGLNEELFYPAVAVKTAILILRLGEPDDGQTWFADFSEDGLTRDRTRGRWDKDGTWEQTKAEWLRQYAERSEHVVRLEAEADWNPSVVLRPPVDLCVTDEDLRKTVYEYWDWKIKAAMRGETKLPGVKPVREPTKEERLERLRSRQRVIADMIAELEAELGVASTETEGGSE